MSFLAPLYLAAAAAVALPIIFHLIRRPPQQSDPFGSLMFLRETPPRERSQRRIENWPLLLMRIATLLLLALAFARPFLVASAPTAQNGDEPPVVIAVDRSASMRRENLLADALRIADDQIPTGGQAAVIAFDEVPQVIQPFTPEGSAIRSALAGIEPTWLATDIGSALSAAVGLIESRGEESGGRVILVSDFAAGDSLAEMRSFVWPDNITLKPIRVLAEGQTNASARVVADNDGSRRIIGEASRRPARVRVFNSTDSTRTQFRLRWGDATEDINVQPGQTRTVAMPIPDGDAVMTPLRLVGDDHDFDNAFYYFVAPPKKQTLAYAVAENDEALDQEKLSFFLRRVNLSDSRREVTVSPAAGALWDPELTPLLIATTVADVPTETIKSYVEAGGHVVAVLDQAKLAAKVIAWVNSLTDGNLELIRGDASADSLLATIDFDDPLFAPVAAPPFNDFSKIRFWRHRRLKVDDEARVIARFDDGDPAVVSYRLGRGRIDVWPAGWQPSESQWALSTKFVPVLDAMFSAGSGQDSSLGGQLSADSPTDQPGIFADGTGRRAYNVPWSESRTEPIADATLRRMGIATGEVIAAVDSATPTPRQLDQQSESTQSWWHLLLIAVLVLILIETFTTLIVRRGGTPNVKTTSPATSEATA